MRNKTKLKFALVALLLIFSLIRCAAQQKPASIFDSLKVENLKLRTKIKEVPVSEILIIFSIYEQQIKNCEAAKADIYQASTSALKQSAEKLATVQAELNALKTENSALATNLLTVQTNLQQSLKLQKKARRKIFFERIGTVVLSSAATIAVFTILR